MYSLFDKIFANKVKQAFDNHQEAYNPDDWKKLQNKMSQKRTRSVIWLPHIAKAASVALFIGLSVFVLNVNDKQHTSVFPRFEENKPDTNSSNKNRELIEEKIEVFAKEGGTKNIFVDKQVVTKNDTSFSNDSTNTQLITEADSSFVFDNDDRYFANLKKMLNEHRQEIQKLDKEKKGKEQPLRENANDEFFVENETKKEKRFDFGLAVASVSSYSNVGDADGVKLGGGVSAAYHISKNISFATGMIIAKQSLSFPKTSNNDGAMYSAVALDSERFQFSDNSLQGYSVSTPKRELSFVAIDIPLNIQFELNKFRFSTGVSSLFYVSEEYAYSYDVVYEEPVYNTAVGAIEMKNTTRTVNNEEPNNSFGRFEFARLFNFAVSYNIPLPKGSLGLEPYVKIPMGNISSRDLFIGSGGFALKYNF